MIGRILLEAVPYLLVFVVGYFAGKQDGALS